MKIQFETSQTIPINIVRITTNPEDKASGTKIQKIIQQQAPKIELINGLNNRKILVEINDIVALESEDRMCNVLTIQGEHLLLGNRLKKIEQNTNFQDFIKINNQTIINKHWIKEFHSCGNAKIEVLLANQTTYFVSRHYLKNFRGNLS